MKHFALELADCLREVDSYMSAFAEKIGMHKSKMSRILNDDLLISGVDLDAIIGAFPRPEHKRRLVAAYIKDLASPGALACVRGEKDDWSGVEFTRFTKQGQAAATALLKSDHCADFERVAVSLAIALGLIKKR
jgi:hypothetical protein